MTVSKFVRNLLLGAVWVGAIVAALVGIWLPLIVLLGISGLVVLAFAWPALWQKLAGKE